MQGESVMYQIGEVLFSLAIFVKTIFQAFGLLPAPCEEPLLYTLGAIDSRFGITEAEVLAATQKAEALWEDASGQNLFEYNEKSGLPVQFVYDERQQKTQAQADLEARLNGLQLEESEVKAKEQIAKYEAAKREYEKKVSSYESAANAYNERVTKINRAGGATEAEQKDLKKQQQALQAQFQALEADRQKVNSLVVTANQRITANQKLVETYNKEVTTFQEKYGGEGEMFDQGVYTGNDITVYQYDDAPRLIMVLAHEMGHALGIDHVEEPKALMHYLMRDQDISTIALAEADVRALKNTCQKPKFPWQS